jgi:hypothetical protein
LHQTRRPGGQVNRIETRHGQVRLRSVAVAVEDRAIPSRVDVAVGNQAVEAATTCEGNRVLVQFAREIVLSPGQSVQLTLV